MSISRPPPPGTASGPMSPMSDSYPLRYGSMGSAPGEPPFSAAPGPYGAPRLPQNASPPGSNHPSTSTDSSRPSASGSSIAGRPPSSASSIGMGSNFGGRARSRTVDEDRLQRHYHVLKGYLGASLRDEKGNIKPNKARDKLLRLSVTQFMELSTDVYDELVRREDQRMQRVANVPPSLPPKRDFHPKRNQARQKLSTLPTDRFRQLATDVYYELERRIPRFAGSEMDRRISDASVRSMGMRPPPGHRGPPPGPGGRVPMVPNGMPPPNGMYPPGGVTPPNAMSPTNGMSPPIAPYQNFRPHSPGPGGPARPPTGSSDGSNFNRPLPKTFQSNTIVPNKSTMVEDDDDEEDEEDAFNLEKQSPDLGEDVLGSAGDRERIRDQEVEIAELKEKIESLEGKYLDKEQEFGTLKASLTEKDLELEKIRSSGQDREAGLSTERSEWYSLREELEQKHIDAQHLNSNLQRELDLLKESNKQQAANLRAHHDQELEDVRSELATSHQRTIGDLRAQLGDVTNETGDLQRQLQTHRNENEILKRQLQSAQQRLGDGDHERRIGELEAELAVHQKSTADVQEQAMLYLQEMRDLSRQNDQAIEREEKLEARVSQLESEIETWRRRYAKVKAQYKHLRASTMGLGLQTSFDSGSLVRKEGLLSQSGLVRDIDVTQFQLNVDELLKVARQAKTEPMLEGLKNVVLSVQSITSAVGTDGYPTPSPSPLGPDSTRQPIDSVARLKARVTGTANSLITATKQHATASGLSPVALLDAAASNLTASVVELIKAVGIRPTPKEDLHSDVELDVSSYLSDEDNHDQHSFYDDRLSLEDSNTTTTTDKSAPVAVEVSSPAPSDAKPSPLSFGLARSNTYKKANAWFGGWGKKTSVDETPVPQTPGLANGHPQTDEYDPYR
ncbi:Protein SPA2 [Teratosphaeria destructans]|uniref:Protein SPA2 n=1 Tax=Teratosphaeria destructans TaxID=418781 RepID=A0A9W7T1W0_9PEZI|nr:Protein SPA2 [Teratosphaeria destructans]